MANKPDCQDSVVSNLRDVRYCEVIPVVVDKDTQTQTLWIYNTLCCNDCPSNEWEALTWQQATIDFKQENPTYDAAYAILNGPRHWVMDQLEGSGASTGGPTCIFGGIEMTYRGKIASKGVEAIVEDKPWVPHQVQRQTVYTYNVGEYVYELKTPEDDIYIMQSYSQQVDPSLTIDQLSSLGPKLTFPTPGWRYTAHRLEQQFVLTTTSVATVMQDNFKNTYQRRYPPPPSD